MNFLNEEDISKGAIVPIYTNDKIEGYAKLLKTAGEPLSFMEVENDEEDGIIYVKQRWLIKWVSPDQIKKDISRELLWTQMLLEGNRTHRRIVYLAAASWEQYAYRYGGLKDKNYYDRGDTRPLPDNNILF